MRLLLLLAAGGIGAWGILHSPWYEEWQLARQPLPALARLAGKRLDDVNDPRLLYYIGLRLNQQGRFADADPILRRGVGIDPDSPRLRDEWARALMGSGLVTAAFGQLREFVGTHPKVADAHLLLGKFYFTERSMRRAAEELRQAVELDPGLGEGWAYLAGAEDELGNREPSLQAAEKAVSLRPNNAVDHLRLAFLLGKGNVPAQARDEYARAVDLAPRQALPHREYARWLLELGTGPNDPQLAETEARKAVALDPNDALAQLTLGRTLVRNHQPQAALDPLTRAATLDSYDPMAPQILAQAYQALGREKDTAEWQEKFLARQRDTAEQNRIYEALRVHPDDADLHRRMARLLGRHGDVAGCIHNQSMALHCNVDAPPALIAAANDLTDGGHADEALPLARRAVGVSAANPSAHEALGNALLELGQVHLAGLEYNKTASWWPKRTPILQKRLERYLAYRAAHPPPAELAYQQARTLERQNFGPRRMTPEVERYAQQAVNLEPANPTYLWYLLRVQMAQRENEAAIPTARQLLAVVPKDARAHAMLALLLVDKAATPAEFAEVETQLQAASTDSTADPTRHYVSGLLALRRQQGTLAVRELRQTVDLDPVSDVTYYKLALAEKMVGDTTAAEKAMTLYHRRLDDKRQEAEALSDLSQHPERPENYSRAAKIFAAHGLQDQADAILAEAHRRFDTHTSSSSPGTTHSRQNGAKS